MPRYEVAPGVGLYCEDFGDGLLMRLGLTVIWVGWQFDVPERDGALRLEVPVATDDGAPIEGFVRSDWTIDRAAETLHIGHRNHRPYPVADPHHAGNVLTVRDGRMAERTVIPRDRWELGRLVAEEFVPVASDDDRPTHIRLDGGFEAGRIYELVYRARDPVVVGLGLAAIRDVMSYAKYADGAAFPVDRGLAFGVSQTGRFLRHLVYQGFNTDEQGRQVYDGLLVHTAGGGRGSFNHRFGQPSRDAHRYSAFFYPTDIFPFTGRTQTDPLSGQRDGLLAHAFDPTHLPKIFYTNTGYEYWGRAASLVHTTPDGTADVELLPNERLYHLASGQHSGARFPPRAVDRLDDSPAYRGNPLDFLTTLRALLVDLVEWVDHGALPPASSHPTIRQGTLVGIDRVDFPDIPGAPFPEVIHEAYRADYGERWAQGIVDVQPPRLGPAHPSLVSQVDAFGNEIAGVRALELLVPLATYAPWQLRAGYPGAEDELVDFRGTWIPLPRTEAERAAAGDPRPSVELLYPSRQDYLAKAARAAISLVDRRYLLAEDLSRVLGRAEDYWDLIVGGSEEEAAAGGR